jgi:hypothetical protein
MRYMRLRSIAPHTLLERSTWESSTEWPSIGLFDCDGIMTSSLLSSGFSHVDDTDSRQR